MDGSVNCELTRHIEWEVKSGGDAKHDRTEERWRGGGV